MGMSMHCTALRPPDEKWRKMKAAWDACKAAGTEPPKEVDDFFDGYPPDPAGVEVGSVGQYTDDKDMPPWVKNCDLEGCDGFEIDVSKLPKDVTVVRFFCSY